MAEALAARLERRLDRGLDHVALRRQASDLLRPSVGFDLAPGARSPLHTLSQDKVFAVLQGTVRLEVGDTVTDADAGTTAQVPAGTPHRYEVTGAPARMLVITTGAGQLAFLAGMSRLTAGGPPEPSALAAHTAAHGVRLLAPTA